MRYFVKALLNVHAYTAAISKRWVRAAVSVDVHSVSWTLTQRPSSLDGRELHLYCMMVFMIRQRMIHVIRIQAIFFFLMAGCKIFIVFLLNVCDRFINESTNIQSNHSNNMSLWRSCVQMMKTFNVMELQNHVCPPGVSRQLFHWTLRDSFDALERCIKTHAKLFQLNRSVSLNVGANFFIFLPFSLFV